jgi:hypothetical protein
MLLRCRLGTERGCLWHGFYGCGAGLCHKARQGQLRELAGERELGLACRVHRRDKRVPGVTLIDQARDGERGRGYSKKILLKICISHITLPLQKE